MSSTPAHGRRVQLAHLAGLDGIRGLAVIAVLLFHAGVPWATGGFIGVEVFFVLSGFLITSLLVGEWRERGRISLRAFWARRARRLLPALFVLTTVIGIYYAIAGSGGAVPGLLGDGLAALFYYSNWHQLAQSGTYFAEGGRVSPFQHTWSLSIEEQFYVVWPLLVLLVLGFVAARGLGRSGRRPLGVLLLLTIAGAAASWLAMLVLFHSSGVNRVYFGSDTRASGLLTGAALAVWLALHQERLALRTVAGGVEFDAGPLWTRRPPWASSARVSVASGVVLALLVVLMCTAPGTSAWMYPWGMLVVDLSTALLVAAIIQQPRSIAGGLMRLRAMRAVGRISYGLYLWHFPLFLWLTTESTGLGGPALLLVRLAAAFGASIVSYVFVEQPIRLQRRPVLAGWPHPLSARPPARAGGRVLDAGDWLTARISRWAPPGVVAAVAALLAASAAGALPTAVPDAAALRAPANLAGAGPACAVHLVDGSSYGVAPVALDALPRFVVHALDSHGITWRGQATATFHTCPPKRVLLVGDSIAFTLGAPMLLDQQRYGLTLINAAVLGCAFAIEGEIDINGTWQSPADGCPDALGQWAALADRMRPQVVVFEMGYRDQFDWRWNGHAVHLGEPRFDAYVRSRIEQYVDLLGDHGRRRVLLLTVPFVNPPALPDGAPAPAASLARHRAINALLAEVAQAHRRTVALLDINTTVAPAGTYTSTVDGELCRFDGVHFTTFCAKLLEPPVLTKARALAG